MQHHSGMSLVEVLVTLIVLSFVLICVVGDGVIRQKKYRQALNQMLVFQQTENRQERTGYPAI